MPLPRRLRSRSRSPARSRSSQRRKRHSDDEQETVDLDDIRDEISAPTEGVAASSIDSNHDHVLLWASKQTGLSISKLRDWQCQTWEVVARSLAIIGDDPIRGLPLDWNQENLRFFGLSEAGAARVREKLRGLRDLHQYLKALPEKGRPCFTSLCNQGILTLKAYKLHYEQTLL